MSTLTFADTHNMVAFLEKPTESDGFHDIIDFLNANLIRNALTVNPTIYTSCIQQFWASARAKTVNGVRKIQAIIDKKKLIITETSIRSDLYLEDAGAFFSPQWKYLIHTITQCLSAKSTAWNEFSSTMASLIICLATNQRFNLSKYIFDAMVIQLSEGKFLISGEDSNHPTDSNQIPIIDQPSTSSQPKKKQKSKKAQRKEAEVPQDKTEHEESVPQAKEIAALKKRVQRLERKKKSRTTGLKRLKKAGMSRRIESFEDQESLGDHEDASKHGKILDIDEMLVEAKIDEKDKQGTKLDDSTAGEAATTASVEAKPKVVTTAATTTTTTRPKARGVVVQEPSEFRTSQEVQPSITKDKGKGIMVEPKVPLKRKDQVALDEQMERDVQAQL
ncbi:hypothetical protein Tco_0289827 [Tanacetum coccineum]